MTGAIAATAESKSPRAYRSSRATARSGAAECTAGDMAIAIPNTQVNAIRLARDMDVRATLHRRAPSNPSLTYDVRVIQLTHPLSEPTRALRFRGFDLDCRIYERVSGSSHRGHTSIACSFPRS